MPGKINHVEALSVFSSLYFDMLRMNDKMVAIKKYFQGNGGVINTVTRVKLIMNFNYRSIINMITLLTYFPNLDTVEVRFNDICDASINDDQIHQLFSAVTIKSVNRLSIYYFQEEETTAFCRFIVELMKRCRNMSSLEFYYNDSSSFAVIIKEMIKREDIKFAKLDMLSVDYWSINIDISTDLFYVAEYGIKNLTMDMRGSTRNLDELDQFEYFLLLTLIFIYGMLVTMKT